MKERPQGVTAVDSPRSRWGLGASNDGVVPPALFAVKGELIDY
jgi:hypothetical protein